MSPINRNQWVSSGLKQRGRDAIHHLLGLDTVSQLDGYRCYRNAASRIEAKAEHCFDVGG